ncbi:uncharacterized protein TRUGW13939_03740 [Talaromyces rugulosus]|uniref:Uncharacterized protein n=1 Tax=Talaromyces rugulosus TaxID=121627 RepID=A0A7H8QT14_TALRU|nr:uncharacterized protein TRUGW13939_03740 [Talaromyces rugulosus]QKX56635.1 hypothetical protein TRUGW13939_03740 [Talaromyces rugulosus]
MNRLLSPPSEEDGHRPSSQPTDHVPLESSVRTTPIHPELPAIRVPGNDERPSCHYDPVTCEPMNIEDLRTKLQQLRKEHPSRTAILKAQEDAAKEIKQRMEEADRKKNEIQKVLDKKMKEWDMEYKVLSKYQATKVTNLPS